MCWWLCFCYGRYASRNDCGSRYEVRVELLNETQEPVQTFAPDTVFIHQWSDEKWHEVWSQHLFICHDDVQRKQKSQRQHWTCWNVFFRWLMYSRTTDQAWGTSGLPTEEKTRSSGQGGMEFVSLPAALRSVSWPLFGIHLKPAHAFA